LLASVYAAAAANTLVVYPQSTVSGGVNEFVVTVAGAVTVPAGYTVIIDAVTAGTPTITGNGASGEVFVAGDSNFDYIPTGGSGTLLSGTGSDTFVAPAYLTGFGYTLLGSGSIVTSGSSIYVETISNAGTYSYSQNVGYVFGSYVITNTAPGATTVTLNSYAETVNALSNGGVYNDDSYMTFINGGANTVVGSASTKLSTIYGKNFNMLVTQGADTASLVFINGAGNSTLTGGAAGGLLGFDGAEGTINLTDTNSTGFNYLVGVTGAETLNAAATTGTAVLMAGQANAYAILGSASADAFFGGTGASTVVGGTASGSALPDLYAFSNGASGGSDLIQNWGTASGLVFLGYGAAGDTAIKAAIAAAPTNSSSVSITLPDKTVITVVGINGANVHLASNPVYLS
jgi:hypothetical protein